jgi:hypothetical protein
MHIVFDTLLTTSKSSTNTKTLQRYFGKLHGQQQKKNSTRLAMLCAQSIPPLSIGYSRLRILCTGQQFTSLDVDMDTSRQTSQNL